MTSNRVSESESRKRWNIVVTSRGPSDESRAPPKCPRGKSTPTSHTPQTTDSGARELRSPLIAQASAQAPFGTVISPSSSTRPVGPAKTLTIPSPFDFLKQIGVATISQSAHGRGLDTTSFPGFTLYRPSWLVNLEISCQEENFNARKAMLSMSPPKDKKL